MSESRVIRLRDSHGAGSTRTDQLFGSFFLAGFECSCHVRPDGHRLDLLQTTGHESWSHRDYAAVAEQGLRTVRDGVRWHLIERRPSAYDHSSWLPMLRAGMASGVQIIWDLCHYGWPDHLDIWSAAFVDHFARFAQTSARISLQETGISGWYCPVNEISYWAWAGAEAGEMNPCTTGRADELKRQLVRAYIAAVDAIRSVDGGARFIVSEPLINVVGQGESESSRELAEGYRLAQFQAHDLLTGRLEPGLGGGPQYLDVVGVNFYPHNQWYYGGGTIPLGHHAYRPLREMLGEVFARYERPVFISGTGAEGSARPYWLHHVCAEVTEALEAGVPVQGICIYPITDYPGWNGERICNTGLLSVADAEGRRSLYAPLLAELHRQQSLARAHAADVKQPRQQP